MCNMLYFWKENVHIQVFFGLILVLLTPIEGQEPTFNLTVCDGNTTKLQCPPNYYIEIGDFSYGWSSASRCPTQPEPDGGCVTSGAKSVVSGLCSRRNHCAVNVGPDLLGEPCKGTAKVLQLVYRCKLPLFSSLTCEGASVKLDCPLGSVIDVKGAFWGRKDVITCKDPQKMLSVNCSQPDAKDTVTQLCQFQRSCSLSSSSLLFGEPCDGTYKYLTTSFNCIVCKNEHGSDLDCDRYRSWGQCHEKSDWMLPWCRKSCVQCEGADSCRDTYSGDGLGCRGWASQGHCSSKVLFMARNCRRTCNKCKSCQDYLLNCQSRLDKGECATNTNFMIENCPFSCGICTPVLPVTPRPTVNIPDASTTSGKPLPTLPPAELQTLTTCEAKVADLTCASGYFLVIRDIFFGRRSADVCPHDSITNTSCGLTAEEYSRVMQITQTTCGGRRRCRLPSSTYVFGDTCPGSYKYLVVNFTCEPDAACKDAVSNCPSQAMGGRCNSDREFMLYTCTKACVICDQRDCGNLDPENVNCEYWAMRGECSKNTDWMTTHCRESCRKCKKRILPGIKQTGELEVTVCEGQRTQLGCGSDVLQINSVFYGRQDFTTCVHSTAMKVQNCSDSNILQKIQLKCAANSNCDIRLYTRDYGDPCPGNYKYMIIRYQCIAPELIACSKTCQNGGKCIGRDKCACTERYQGDTCEEFVCNPGCGVNGNCSSPGNCTCNDGWKGIGCATPVCDGVANCWGRGICVAPNKCRCFPFFSGDDCQTCNPSNLNVGSSCLPCVQCDHGECLFDESGSVSPPSFLGCFSSGQNGATNDFDIVAWSNFATTPESCVRQCYNLHYPYAFLQNGHTCACGDTYGTSGASTTCNKVCRDGKNTTTGLCGGESSSSIFRTDEGKCRCESINWSGRRCHQCTDGYSGPTCQRDEAVVPLYTITLPHVPGSSKTSAMKQPSTVSHSSSQSPTMKYSTTLASGVSYSSPKKSTIGTHKTSPTTKQKEISTKSFTSSKMIFSSTVSQKVTKATQKTPFTSSTSGAPESSTSSRRTSLLTTLQSETTTSLVSDKSIPPPTIVSTIISSIEPAKPTETTLPPEVKTVFNVSVKDVWVDAYGNIQQPETISYMTKLTTELKTLYAQKVPELRSLRILKLYKGSVVVEHTLTIQRSSPDITEEDIRCEIWIKMGPNTTLPDGRAVVRTNGTLYKKCMAQVISCEAGNNIMTSDGSVHCQCPANYEGETCVPSKWDPSIAIVVIVIAISVPLLFLVLVCIVLAGRRQAKPNQEYNTSRSFDFHGMSNKRSIHSSATPTSISKGTLNSLNALPSHSERHMKPAEEVYQNRRV